MQTSHNTSSEVELMETPVLNCSMITVFPSQHFFGSGINGNRSF